MKKITILIGLLITSLSFAQDLKLGFETGEVGGVAGGPFGGMPAPVVETGTGTNTSKVLKIVGSGTPEPWQGINLNLTSKVELTATKTMTMDVLSSTPITFLVKVNGGVAGAPEAAAEVTHNGNGQWQTLSFTFNTSLDGKAAAANGIYASFVIHAYWKAGETSFFPNVTTPARTFYVDNIKGPTSTCANGIKDGDETDVDCGGSCAPCPPPPPAVAAPTPTTPNSDVLSIYGDTGGFTNKWTNDYAFGSFVSKPDLDATAAVNEAIKMDFSIAGYGEGKNASIDISAYDFVHFDYYVDASQAAGSSGDQVRFILIGGGEFNYQLTTTAGSDGTLVKGSWQSVKVPLSVFTAKGFNKTNFLQFKLGTESDLYTKIVYFDNIYFSKTPLGTSKFETSSVKMYPNPVKNTLTIEANSEIQRVSVYNILGQEVLKASPKSNSATLQTNELQKGVYMVTTEIDGKLSTSKVVKE